MMKEESFFEKTFERRGIVCFFLIACMMLTCVLRVAVISFGNYAEAQVNQSSLRITVSRQRGNIYDCNMTPITGSTTVSVAAVSCTPEAAVAISDFLDGEELDSVRKTLSSGKPAIVTDVKKKSSCESVVFADVSVPYTDKTPASHIIGYTDDTGHGVCGLEAAYDDLLYTGKTVDAVFSTDGKGKPLAGIPPVFENNDSQSCGVVSTIDVNIQKIAENAAQGIRKGSVIVAEAENAKIRAAVSRPDFDMTDIAKYLDRDDAPLLNRTLCAFSVGSVFKPCVAAAAIESGKSDFTQNCTGSTFIIDRNFNCHKKDGHGLMNMKSALAFSCNSFFYNFAFYVGAEKIYKTLKELNFGSPIKIADNLKTAEGTVPEYESLSNTAMLANLSIGQGSLALSPVSMLTLYCAIAGDGSYYLPSIVERTFNEKGTAIYNIGSPTRVMKKKTADTLKDCLSAVITEGTGTAAAPKNCTAAGKTATAQTGRYENGVEITNSWFCGFFPADNPKYVIIVLSEGVPDTPTASVFAQIADGICEIKNIGG